ncbi:MAG TPA: nuclear transport factor 2 family protein [Pyrinomonadaceae bacterium]|jgi:hypothetical protein|nr:nuclear transport factor 2 family protein [Pyrinomonadaceae bacterium]
MKRATLILCLCFLASTVAGGQTAQKKSDKELKTEQELMALERAIGDANVRRDKAFFERIEADEFIFTDAGGGITTKQEDVSSLDTPPAPDAPRLVSYVPDEMRVYLYDKTAVVFGRVTTTYKNKEGTEGSSQSRFTDVFVWRDERWQLVAGHSSRIPPKQTAKPLPPPPTATPPPTTPVPPSN